MRIKAIFGILIIIIVLISGFIYLDEESINLNPDQFILTDSEIKEVLGNDWIKVPQIGKDMKLLNNPATSLEYKNPKNNNKVEILISVAPNVASVKNSYGTIQAMSKSEAKMNDIVIGDSGKFLSYEDRITIIFIKNNVFTLINFYDTSDMETIYKLAQKQDEKISRVLEMIK